MNGAKTVRELYEIASTNYSGKFTVPVCVFFNKMRNFLLAFFLDFMGSEYIYIYTYKLTKYLIICTGSLG